MQTGRFCALNAEARVLTEFPIPDSRVNKADALLSRGNSYSRSRRNAEMRIGASTPKNSATNKSRISNIELSAKLRGQSGPGTCVLVLEIDKCLFPILALDSLHPLCNALFIVLFMTKPDVAPV